MVTGAHPDYRTDPRDVSRLPTFPELPGPPLIQVIDTSGEWTAVMGGALWTDAESTTNLTQCVWTVNNTAPAGPAVWSHPHGSTSLVQHNTLVVDTQQEAAEAEEWFLQCKIEDGGLDVRVQNNATAAL